jgi:hypothetical protein
MLHAAFRSRNLEEFTKLLDDVDIDPNERTAFRSASDKSLLGAIGLGFVAAPHYSAPFVHRLLQHERTIVDCTELINSSYLLSTVTMTPEILRLYRENKGFSLLKIKLWSDYDTYCHERQFIKLFDIRNRQNRQATSLKYILRHIQLMLAILVGRSRQSSRLRLLSVDQWRYFSIFLF